MSKQVPKYSVIVPVYNRPQEVEELLNSLKDQTVKDFEIVIVEDGSNTRCDSIVDKYRDSLTIQYFYKPNSGPGPSRNFGYQHAKGEYFVAFDSDCIIPSTYFEEVEKSIQVNHWDTWGGPDRAHENFTPIQRAMGYTMASALTTGGIRGGKKHVGWFQPRSFNMGISKRVFEKTGGFKFDRFAEDIELSIRMKQAGFKVGLISEAFVYHKRRTNFKQFYNQVYNFGKGRALVGRAHPGEIKLTHWFPSVFVVGVLSVPILGLLNPTIGILSTMLFLIYLLSIGVHSFLINRNILVAILSVPSAFLQLWGYGIGFLTTRIKSYTD